MSSENNQKDSFLYSLNHASVDDIAEVNPEIEKKRKAAKTRSIIRYVIMGICVCVFVVSAFSIVKTLYGYKQAEEFYDHMYEDLGDTGSALEETAMISELGSFGTINKPKGEDDHTYNLLFERMRSRILALREKNNDVYGWIIIPGTENIDYPIMQSGDNDYYLSRTYSGDYMAAGSIFADYRCDKDINGNFNFIVYGHNMQNRMMFSELIKFLDEDFFNKNQYVYVYTDKGIYTYKIFSVYKTDYKYKYIETGFPSGEEFVKWAEEMRSNSKFKREGISFDTNSRVITLSTCTNALWSDRYCVQALLVDAYNEP
ncbi:MAG: class B sortase [Clostridia bacterium]|nr:class B sortase [Clostridia bacterium]